MKKKIELVMAVILLTSAFFLARKGSVLVNNGKAEEKRSASRSMPDMAEMIRERSGSMMQKKKISIFRSR